MFPDIIGIQSAYHAKGRALPVDVTRFWDLDMATPAEGEFRSIQSEITRWFPTAAKLDADVVLGGFSSLHVRKGTPFKRLATFATATFDWLHDLSDSWSKAALEASLESGVSRAWLHGTN